VCRVCIRKSEFGNCLVVLSSHPVKELLCSGLELVYNHTARHLNISARVVDRFGHFFFHEKIGFDNKAILFGDYFVLLYRKYGRRERVAYHSSHNVNIF
jgi:hypothetical protein